MRDENEERNLGQCWKISALREEGPLGLHRERPMLKRAPQRARHETRVKTGATLFTVVGLA